VAMAVTMVTTRAMTATTIKAMCHGTLQTEGIRRKTTVNISTAALDIIINH